MSAATAPAEARRAGAADLLGSAAQRNAWILGLIGFLALLLVFTKLIQPNYGVAGVQGLGISVLPLALAAVAQAVVVISGGIDLSIGSMMALTSVVAAVLMKGQSEEFGVAVVLGVLLLGLVLGAVNGGLVVVTRVPDIVGHARDVVRVGRLRAARAPERAGRRLGAVAQGPRHRVARQRVDPQGGRRPGRHRGRHLDPGPALEAGPVDLRDRQQPAGGVPERRVRSAGRRSSPTP